MSLCIQCNARAITGENLCSNCKYPYYDSKCESCRNTMRVRTGKDQRPHICYTCRKNNAR